MDDFPTWLNTTALAFARLVCPPSFTTVVWTWRVSHAPFSTTGSDREYLDTRIQHATEAQVARSAHERLVIARQEPAIRAGFAHHLATLRMRVKAPAPLLYHFHIHPHSHGHNVSVGTSNDSNTATTNHHPLTTDWDLDRIVRALRTTHRGSFLGEDRWNEDLAST